MHEEQDDRYQAARSTMVHNEDQFLMFRLQKGDQDAFTQLFDKWKRPLISYFYRSIGDVHTAEDLALEVATRVYRSRMRYRARARFSTWLFQIARNRLIDWYRKQGKLRAHGLETYSADLDYPGPEDPGNPHSVHQWEEWLQESLKDIPESERTALLLVVQQGMKPAEAAETMKLTPNHLRVLLSKARKRLRTLLESES